MNFSNDSYGLSAELHAKKIEAEKTVLGLMFFDPAMSRRITYSHSIGEGSFSGLDYRLIFSAILKGGAAGIDCFGCICLAWARLINSGLAGKLPGQWPDFELVHLANTVRRESIGNVPSLIAQWCERLSYLTKQLNLAQECFDAGQRVLREGLTHRVSLPTGAACLISKKPEAKITRDKRAVPRSFPPSAVKAMTLATSSRP